MKKLLFLIPLTAFLYDCGEDVKTVEYWKQHQDELKVFLKKCRNGEIDKTHKHVKMQDLRKIIISIVFSLITVRKNNHNFNYVFCKDRIICISLGPSRCFSVQGETKSDSQFCANNRRFFLN